MGTRDFLLLAITRVANAYGVPLWGFFVASAGCVLLFSWLVQFVFTPSLTGLATAAGISGAIYLVLVVSMARLSAWEPKWFSILSGWAQTRLPVLFARTTRHFGGTTLCPAPATTESYEDARDYVG